MPYSKKRGSATLRDVNGQLRARPGRRRAPRATAAKDRPVRGDPGTVHKTWMMDGILNDPGDLNAYTGLTTRQFDYLLDLFMEEIGRRHQTRLFGDGGNTVATTPTTGPDSGNRRRLDHRHALLLTLMDYKTAVTSWRLAAIFGPSPATISSYISLCRPVLAMILPSPRAIADEIAACRTAGELRWLIYDDDGGGGGGMPGDRIRTPRARHPLRKTRKRPGPDGTEKHPPDTPAAIGRRNAIPHAGSVLSEILRDAIPANLPAGAFPETADPGTPRGDGNGPAGDSGSLECAGPRPGTAPVRPAKRTRRIRPAAARNKKGNGTISLKRTGVGSVIGRMRHYKILQTPHRGTPELRRSIIIVAGLVNYTEHFEQIRDGTGQYGSMMAKERQERLNRSRRR